jgi:aspartate 1-decarboxylase
MSYNSPFTGNVIQPTDVSYRSITLTSTLQLQWPINGSTTDDTTARIMEVSTSSTAYQLWMPPANQASVGQDALIRNTGMVDVDVYDYDGQNTIVTVSAGESQYIYITDNPDESGTWGIIAFGIGSSGADAATLAGYGLLAIGQTLNQAQPVTTFSSDYTALTSDRSNTYVWTGGAGTLTLTAASTLGDNWFMFLRNGGSGTLTVAGSGGNTINGSASLLFQPNDSAIIVCSGTTFYTVGLGKSTQFNFTQLTKNVTTGTYTLTAIEAANVIQKYTGTLTGNVTIIVPETVQIYFVQNATTAGAYTLTISTGVGGAASAIISAGNQATLICDSQNLLNANTVLAGSSVVSLQDGTVTNPSLNFGTEPTTGIYRAASGEFNISILGTLVQTISATGLTIVGDIDASGTGNFVGGVSGGVFV